MTFDMNSMNSLFATQGIPQQQWLNNLQFGANGPLTGIGMLNQFPVHPNVTVPGVMATQQLLAPPPTVQQMEPPKADSIQGIGHLTWLSAKAGLITCKDKMVISFQLKDFCDQMLNDLTSVLRVGFTLSFQAALNETSEYTATLVQPIYGSEADIVFQHTTEVDLEAAQPTPPNSKDAYSPQIEARAIPALLAIFQRHGLQQIQLSSLHSQMSNCGDEELFRYVGTSSLKRRQFVERRTHIFRLQNDDSIILQVPAVYTAVCRLASFLLRRGGCTAIQSLFDYYMNGDIAAEIREQVGEGRQDFLNLITAHNWVFALFPNRTYVSVRRNLPRYDYPTFIKTHFPELDMSMQRRTMSQSSYGQPRGIQRTMSVQQSMVGAFGGAGAASNVSASRQQSLMLQQQQLNSATRPINLWDSQNSLSQGTNGASDQWSPLFSPQTWSNSTVPRVNGITALSNDTLLGGSNINTLLGLASTQKTMVNRGVQMDSDVPIGGIGRGGCTCQCMCGRANNNVGVIGGNIGSSSRGSASPPSLDSNSPYDRFSPSNAIGSIGDRLTSNLLNSAVGGNTNSDASISAPSSGPATSSSTNSSTQRYYDPFGTAELLNSHLSSLRI